MNYTIDFHGPFRVATGAASRGLDATVDPTCWLPTTSLKGVMRASARLLGIGDRSIDDVFGTARSPSPWSWSDVTFDGEHETQSRARIRISSDTGTVARGALFIGEEAWARTARFSIDQRALVPDELLPVHDSVLRIAAAGVRSIGSGRNRGMGWVSISPEVDVTADDLVRVGLGVSDPPPAGGRGEAA